MSLVIRICAVLMFVLSVGLVLFSFIVFAGILYIRQYMFQIRNGDTGEEKWGFGQICALFVWAPLFVELGGSAFNLVRAYCGWKQKSEDYDISYHVVYDSVQ